MKIFEDYNFTLTTTTGSPVLLLVKALKETLSTNSNQQPGLLMVVGEVLLPMAVWREYIRDLHWHMLIVYHFATIQQFSDEQQLS